MDIVVIKIGSSIITNEGGLNENRINELAAEISVLQQTPVSTVVVSSGAVAAGRSKLNITGRINDINLKQAAAAIGQSSLVWAYERSFARHERKVAQVLLTRDAFSDRKRYLNARNTLNMLISLNVIPIINENDTVSIDELKFGDNDRLAALVAAMLKAQRLVILSDVDGLYTDDPGKNDQATLIRNVSEITPELESKAKGSGSVVGTGGMYSKVMAARLATSHGVTVNIISGKTPGLLEKLFDGTAVGTEFEAAAKAMAARKGWIAAGTRPKGSITLDDGAVEAIVRRGKSLLPSGVRSMEGYFKRGDAVYCLCTDGTRVAKGLINYSYPELSRIAGLKTSQIEETLGYKYSDEVIYRDNLIII